VPDACWLQGHGVPRADLGGVQVGGAAAACGGGLPAPRQRGRPVERPAGGLRRRPRLQSAQPHVLRPMTPVGAVAAIILAVQDSDLQRAGCVCRSYTCRQKTGSFRYSVVRRRQERRMGGLFNYRWRASWRPTNMCTCTLPSASHGTMGNSTRAKDLI
jgi:hypothetical protein